MSDYLSHQELKDWSELERPTAILRWLNREKIPYIMGGAGWPRVMRCIRDQRQGSLTIGKINSEPQLRLKHG